MHFYILYGVALGCSLLCGLMLATGDKADQVNDDGDDQDDPEDPGWERDTK
jgi:hypothetical protein